MALLKAGAEADKKDNDGYLALDLAPDQEVSVAFGIRHVNTDKNFANMVLLRFAATSSVPPRRRA
ncbi:hypothetical protein LY78DRAFT_664175 [Colletotrichum sublineola]|nr:hypothetical protein LY78DRAFT_664175 [Colletotrichum sublineola]